MSALNEESFARHLPAHLQKISKTHFTPLLVARTAAEWLSEEAGRNILDIGAGIGKFCIAGALHTGSTFVGAEYRPSLVRLARQLIETWGCPQVRMLETNITALDFSDFNAFYIYNPFYENLLSNKRLNDEVALSEDRYRQYRDHCREQLGRQPAGTRIVTYHGDNMEIPPSYEMLRAAYQEQLKLWIKI